MQVPRRFCTSAFSTSIRDYTRGNSAVLSTPTFPGCLARDREIERLQRRVAELEVEILKLRQELDEFRRQRLWPVAST